MNDMIIRSTALAAFAGWLISVVPARAGGGSDDGLAEALGILLVSAIVLAIYFIPSVVAFRRGHPNRWVISAINLLFGGTGIGWIGSLIWAAGAIHQSPTGNNGGESGLNLFVNDPKTVEIRGRPDVIEGAKDDPMDRLRRLKTLREQDLLDEEEYERLRRPLIERLIG